jgi:hypothetical protein
MKKAKALEAGFKRPLGETSVKIFKLKVIILDAVMSSGLEQM